MAQTGTAWGSKEAVDVGVFAETSYVIVGKVAPVLRLGRVTGQGGDNDEQDLTAGAAVFLYGGHAVKWTTDASLLTNRAEGATARVVRPTGTGSLDSPRGSAGMYASTVVSL